VISWLVGCLLIVAIVVVCRSWTISGKFGNVLLRDVDRETLYKVMVNVEGEREMVSFMYRTYSPLLVAEYPGYDRLLIVTINQVHWYWLQKPLSGMITKLSMLLAEPVLANISQTQLVMIYLVHQRSRNSLAILVACNRS
jgi:hypothetical protein